MTTMDGAGGSVAVAKEHIQSQFDQGIALTLAEWPALAMAVQNRWGGPDSGEKRDWFAGAVSELLQVTPSADEEYLEEFLLQVMLDEFEVNVEDDSAASVASTILQLGKMTARGDFSLVQELSEKWQAKQRRGGSIVQMQFVQGDEQADEQESSANEDGSSDDSHDEEMDDLQGGVTLPKSKSEPGVDEDGFTKVTSKKKR